MRIKEYNSASIKQESLIVTGIDFFIEVIKSKKVVTLEKAAKELGISIRAAEEWANYLRNEGIIKIEYKGERMVNLVYEGE